MVLVFDGIKLKYSFRCSVYHTSYLKKRQFQHLIYAPISSLADPTTTHSGPRALHNNEVFLIKIIESSTNARGLYPTHFQDRTYIHKALINGQDYENQNLIL